MTTAIPAIAIGLISGIISGMGIGGGTILIPALVFLYGMEQQAAQGINLIYFIPTATVALVAHIKQGNIEKEVLKPIIIPGIALALIGAFIAVNMRPELLRKIFGGFLMVMGIIEFRKKENKGA